MSKGTVTRSRIITKAAPLFNRKGFDGCSMQDVVEAVGLEKGSLYGHFPTKEALAVAAFDYAWAETCATRTAGIDAIAGAISKLKLHVHNAVTCPSFPGGCPLLNTIIDSDDGNAALKKRARESLREWRSFLEDIVVKGKELREIRADVEPNDVIAVLISLLEGAMVLDRFDRKADFLGRAERHIVAYLDMLAL